MAKEYEARVTRDETGAWIVRVPAITGCHTFGRTIASMRKNTIDVIEAFVELDGLDPDYTVRYTYDLPKSLKSAVAQAVKLREKAQTAQREATHRTRDAAAALIAAGVSMRDAGELLEISHQRVAQLVAETSTVKAVRQHHRSIPTAGAPQSGS